MHYHAEVWIKTNENVESQVESALAPYDEDLQVIQREEDGETWWENPDGWFDWWEIGGRWKGEHVEGYDPTEDPAHLETCDICGGTGDRPGWVLYIYEEDGTRKRTFKDAWAKECNGCNSCLGTGKRLSWPTGWKQHHKDVIPIADIRDDLTCYTLVVGDKVMHDEIYTGDGFADGPMKNKTVKQALAELGVKDGYLVTVDYHC